MIIARQRFGKHHLKPNEQKRKSIFYATVRRAHSRGNEQQTEC
jgi:hypothetical protein